MMIQTWNIIAGVLGLLSIFALYYGYRNTLVTFQGLIWYVHFDAKKVKDQYSLNTWILLIVGGALAGLGVSIFVKDPLRPKYAWACISAVPFFSIQTGIAIRATFITIRRRFMTKSDRNQLNQYYRRSKQWLLLFTIIGAGLFYILLSSSPFLVETAWLLGIPTEVLILITIALIITGRIMATPDCHRYYHRRYYPR